jgi:predicted aldo/keto reductase-like oxidoreductase
MTYIIHLVGTLHGRHYASLCTECGRCVKKCPQHLPVPELLKDVADEFEGVTMKPMAWIVGRAVSFMTWRDKRKGRKAQ